MNKINSSKQKQFSSPPFYKVLILGLFIIVLVPISFLGANVYRNAWKNAWREISEKHHLLAMNMASPISIYIKDHKTILNILGNRLVHMERERNSDQIEETLQEVLDLTEDFGLLALVGADGTTKAIVSKAKGKLAKTPNKKNIFTQEECFLKTREQSKEIISNVTTCPITGKPTIRMTQPLMKGGEVGDVLIAQLKIDTIEKLRKDIHFGEKGHSAIVDQLGHVIAHPNPEWMKEMRDLSHIDIVQKMMAGETGVTEFYSPFIKSSMVAGYTSVPEIGWGIMVPQPKREVEHQVRLIVSSSILWGICGLVFAILLAIPLVRWIVRPIKSLTTAVEDLANNDFKGEIPPAAKHAPREVKVLYHYVKSAIVGFQEVRDEIDQLNKSLQARVQEATHKLRQMNVHLKSLADQDHLTGLANRRYFESNLESTILNNYMGDNHFCIMIIDIDLFKEINDRYGHGAGDVVLQKVGKLLEVAMRPVDLVARWGGDEFVAQLSCERSVGLQRAELIRAEVEKEKFHWEDNIFQVTVSVGVYYLNTLSKNDIDEVFNLADNALYEAKKQGRNIVVELKNDT